MYTTIGQGRVWRGEIRNRAKDGSLYWVDTTIVPVLNERGHPDQYIAIRYDITERKASEAALREQTALAQLGKMAAVVAHEVRNPLAGIRGALQVIARRLPEGGRERGIAAEIISRIDTLNNIVQDLLQFARPRQPVLVDVPIADLVRETATLLREDPNLTNLRIEMQAGPAKVTADREQLKLAILNLLMNSAQAMHGDGTIQISSREENGSVELRILDHGPGFRLTSASTCSSRFSPPSIEEPGSGWSPPAGSSKRITEVSSWSVRRREARSPSSDFRPASASGRRSADSALGDSAPTDRGLAGQHDNGSRSSGSRRRHAVRSSRSQIRRKPKALALRQAQGYTTVLLLESKDQSLRPPANVLIPTCPRASINSGYAEAEGRSL